MSLHTSCTQVTLLSSALVLLSFAAFASEWAVACDDATGLCTSQGTLVSENGGRAATLGLQVAKDGTEAVLFVTTPLGVALRPGLRLRSGDEEFALSYDACYPDGCRATVELPTDRLSAFFMLTSADILMFPFGQEKPVVLSTPLSGLAESFAGKVTFP